MKSLSQIYKGAKTRLKYSALKTLSALSPYIPDRTYLKLRYWLHVGKRLNLNDPKWFTEKIQWLKVHHILERYTDYADKHAAKEIAGNIIGFDHIIPLLGVWESADDVDFDSLPDKFVLKCNHNSGKGMIICRDKSKLDIKAAREELRAGLAEKFHLMAKEYQYAGIKPLIIAETFMEEPGRSDLTDYKFHCFGGEVKICLVVSDRNSKHPVFNYYDADWNLLPLRASEHAADPNPLPKPEQFDEMVRLATKLCQGFNYVRVDLYLINGKIYFGEFTFTAAGGFDVFLPIEWERKTGDWIKLPDA